MRTSLSVKKLSDIEPMWPGFRALWASLKASCGTSQRCPKSLTFTDEPSPMYPNDYDCARRFAIDLATNEVLNSVHVSCGEWAMANRGQERGIDDIPAGTAVVSCTWNDYYRSFSMTVEVAPGGLKKLLTA